MKTLFTALVSCLLLAQRSLACPAIVAADDLRPKLPNAARSALQLFRWQPQAGSKPWQSIPLQVDLRDDNGDLLLPNGKDEQTRAHYRKYRNAGYGDNDRLVFPTDQFGERAQTAALPCGTDRLYEFSDADKYGYLAVCKLPMSRLLAQEPLRFAFQPQQRWIRTPRYQFRYSKRNHILFERILAHEVLVAEKADLRIHSDVKNFFNLDFDSEDVESVISAHKNQRFAFLANLTFYLRIMFFKIDLELNTGMSFFEDFVQIPMVLHMPVKAHKWLNPGSGAFYSWSSGSKDVLINVDESRLPVLDHSLVKKGYKELAKLGLKFCKGAKCTYWLEGRFAGKLFAMSYHLPRRLVKRGFFPLLSTDVDQAERDLGWDDDGDDGDDAAVDGATGKRLGVYFENSGLQEGEHRWEFYIRLDDQQGCPKQVKVKRVLRAAR